MKKLITTALLISAVFTLTFAAPKKANNVKLDVKKKFEIEGVKLGTITWAGALVDDKGEVRWNQLQEGDWAETGWALRGIDLSQYGGIRVELAPKQPTDDMYILISNNNGDKNSGFRFANDGVAYAFFNGSGSTWIDDGMEMPDPSLGFDIKISGNVKKYKKTLIKNIELIKKEDVPDASNLDLMGVRFGTACWKTHIIGNEITWPKGCNDGNAGWNLEGIDLSEYDRVRIEVESNDIPNLEISMDDKSGNNYHAFNQQIEPNVYEADLSGEGASYKNDNATAFNKANGLSIFLHYWNEKPRTKDGKTVVKSVQLLKGKRQPNENLQILGATFGTCGWAAAAYDGGIVDWGDGKEKYPCIGWNVKGIDFSEYNKIRVEVAPETSALPLTLTLFQEKTDSAKVFNAVSSTVLEANFDGSDSNSEWNNKGKWDSSKRIDQIWIRYDKVQKKGVKTIIKSVTLLKGDDDGSQPERLILNGAKLGSKSQPGFWLDEDYAIHWIKDNYSEYGWRIENLEGNILEIKVTSTDVPLNLKIRDYKKNEAEWTDDGSHLFRIDLKTKKMLRTSGGKKDPNWTSQTKPFDFSDGGEIIFVPTNGVSKEGKKTVVEYVKVE